MTTTDHIAETAHAKINLALHVTGQRADGYHLLDSMVVFAEFGDRITVEASEDLTLNITGPFGAALDAQADNLVLRAARLLDPGGTAAITLEKNLPVASGIGGGSSDAAATLRALSRLWGMPLPDEASLLSLGADVPVCMSAEAARMAGIGEQIERLGPAPSLDILLVNPGVAVSTPAVFDALAQKANPALADNMPDPFETDAWIDWLCAQRNDLEPVACALEPRIEDVLSALRNQPGQLLARMSGSGATCFALFEDTDLCLGAADEIRRQHPDWWVAPTFEAPITGPLA